MDELLGLAEPGPRELRPTSILGPFTSEFFCPVRGLGRDVLWGGRTTPVPERRYSKRSPRKQRASLVLDLKQQPCLVLDSSNNGLRVRGSFHLRRGQTVEVILDEDPLNPVRCSVVWVGKAGSKQEGEVGLETV